MSQRKFISLFHDAKATGKQVVILSDEATAYIKACCEDRDAAVQLLRDSGFELHFSGNDPERVRDLNRHWKQSLIKYGREGVFYEEFVSGDKQAGWWPFWSLFTKYQVTIFIKRGKVDFVSAGTYADLPF